MSNCQTAKLLDCQTAQLFSYQTVKGTKTSFSRRDQLHYNASAKRSSLFVIFVDEDEIKFYSIDHRLESITASRSSSTATATSWARDQLTLTTKVFWDWYQFYKTYFLLVTHEWAKYGRESTINRSLDGSIYPGLKLVPLSKKFIFVMS